MCQVRDTNRNRALWLAHSPHISPLIGWHHDDDDSAVSACVVSSGLTNGSPGLQSSSFLSPKVWSAVTICLILLIVCVTSRTGPRPIPDPWCSLFPQVSTNCPRLSAPITLRIHQKNWREKMIFDGYNLIKIVKRCHLIIKALRLWEKDFNDHISFY